MEFTTLLPWLLALGRRERAHDLFARVAAFASLNDVHHVRARWILAMKESRQTQYARDIFRVFVATVALDQALHHPGEVHAALLVGGPVIRDQPVAVKFSGRRFDDERWIEWERSAMSGIVFLPERAEALDIFGLAAG